MNDGYVFLAEKEEMWARMLIRVLEDNQVSCVAIPVFGAGFAMKTGTRERLKIYVPSESFTQAMALVEELFSAESILEDEEAVN